MSFQINWYIINLPKFMSYIHRFNGNSLYTISVEWHTDSTKTDTPSFNSLRAVLFTSKQNTDEKMDPVTHYL